jgi:hypothetical protein
VSEITLKKNVAKNITHAMRIGLIAEKVFDALVVSRLGILMVKRYCKNARG